MKILKEDVIVLNIQRMKLMYRNMELRISRMIKKVKIPKIINIRTTLRVKQNLTKIQMKLIILSSNL